VREGCWIEGTILARFFTLLLALIVGTAAGVQAQTTANAATGADFRDGVERQTFALVNAYRKSNFLAPMRWDDAIAKAARAHSQDMAGGAVDFGHDGFRDRVNRLRNIMGGFEGAGENVLMTSDLTDVPKKAVALWLRSPHHLANIRGDFNYSGLGVWQDKKGVIYFTQIFMKFTPPTEEAKTGPPPELATPFGMLATPNTRARP